MTIYSYEQYQGDGVTDTFSVPFEYLLKDHVTVRVDGEEVAFTWTNAFTIKTDDAPASGSVVVVRRSTPVDHSVTDFQDGSTLEERDLDRQASQLLYIVQEAYDRLTSLIELNSSGNFDAGGHRISNVADGVDAHDALTVGQLSPYLDDIKAMRQLAEDAKDAAETAQSNAETAQAGAETAQSNSETAQSNAEAAKAGAEAAQAAAEDARDAALEAVYDYVGGIVQNPILEDDVVLGDGTTSTFTLSQDMGIDYEAALLVSVGGVVQSSDTYTVSGTSLTFDEAPPNGVKIYIRYIGALAVAAAEVAKIRDEVISIVAG